VSSSLGNIPAHCSGTSLAFSSVDTLHADAGFGPCEHILNLHPLPSTPGSRRRGVVAFAQRTQDKDKPWREWTVPAGDKAVMHAKALIRASAAEDLYVSQAAFWRWRGIADLSAIGANFADLDYQTRARWSGYHPCDVATAVVGVLEQEGIPLPSYILSTGRGLCCVWLTELLPPVVLPRWNLVQKTLAGKLAEFGADKRALDAARVFRLVGSINSRAEWDRRTVGLVWYQGNSSTPTRHQFTTLADEVLPHTSAELVSLRAARAARKAEGHDMSVKRSQTYNQATLWSTVLEDLHKLRKHRNAQTGALPCGQRDAWVFVAATALAWLAPADVMAREIQILAAQAAGWTDKETAARMCSVVKRARQSEAGILTLFDGRQVDPRYRMRAETIVDWLAIQPGEMRAANLRVLIDSSIATERATERQAASRRRKGAKNRSEQQAARLDLGRKCLYLAAKDGMNRADLATYFGVSTGQISKAMADARAFAQQR